MTWCILDLETNNHEYYGSLASPHHPDNYIVAAGWVQDNLAIQAEYYNNPEEAKASDWLVRALAGQQVMVAHNLTFEVHWLLKTYPTTFLDFLKRGGRVFCTQYSEFLLSHQTELYPSLEETAAKYGGSKKIDEVKILWEAGVLTKDIDQALLMKYLADPHVGDVANTRLALFAQVALLKERGMYEMFKMRMDSLLFNAIASFYGLHVDMQVAAKNQAESEAQIATLQEGIMALLPKDLPPELEFSFTSGFHKSAFMFGGAVKYDKKVSYDPVKYVKVDTYHFKDGYSIPIDEYNKQPTYDRNQDLSDHGDLVVYASGKNKGNPKEFKDDTSEELLKWGVDTYTFKGLINLNDLPEHVSEQYLGKRAEFKGRQTLADDTPVYSTGKDSLDVLANFSDAAKPIKDLATLEKDVGTYYLRTDPKTGKQSGMLQYVEPDGIIHHQLNNCATVTGRLSSSKP